ncbi:MFS transporter [Acetivibrio ethanolgignens]|uniref:Major facilitator superfamily (MFS) profile domain-containing protein n=1 Tax=Acetivibrio ethanolgignens TaxID=290052 RepID=A0A0V8QIB3_9FIRM|nr:MFS transporter [Acetivibrio ethanolgignens]KSV60347.1 hypothetical protein ASU35_17065 [Acetivibrio ethanolgignens]
MVLDKKTVCRKNIILLLAGRMVSELFTSMFNFGISLYILKITNAGLPFAVSLVIGALPKILFSYVAGNLSDKKNRKKMIIVCDTLSGTVLLLFFLLFDFGNPILGVYIINFLLSTISVFFSISINGMVPQIVYEEEHLSRVNAMSQTVSSLASFLGPILGGLCYENFQIKNFIILNVCSFFISGISELFIVLDRQVVVTKKSEVQQNKSEINHFLHERKDIYQLIISCAFVNFFLAFGFTVPMPYIVNNVLKMSSFEYGILRGSIVVGSLLASVCYSIHKVDSDIVEKYYRSIAGLGIVYIGFSFTGLVNANYVLIVLILIFALSSICIVSINVPLKTMLQKEIPNEIRGRVFGVLNIYLSLAGPIGNVLSGILIDRINAFYIPLFAGMILIIITLVLKVNRRVDS